MDELEIIVFDEIKDYKEKIYFFNFRQWIFAILIVGLVVPVYLILKNKIGEEITSYIVIIISGILGFIGFVKIHELPAERILPYWFRHYFFFTKTINYMTDSDFEELRSKKRNKHTKISKLEKKKNKEEIRKVKNKKKQERILAKARKKMKKYEIN